MSIRPIVGLLLLSIFLTACNNPDDPPPPPPPSIVGNYTGIYQYIEIHDAIDTSIDTTQLIEFTFRQNEFTMDMDASISEDLRVFCDVVGTYELGNGLELHITDSNFVGSVCTQNWGPGGSFSLNQTSDTLRMLSERTDTAGVQQTRYLRVVNID